MIRSMIDEQFPEMTTSRFLLRRIVATDIENIFKGLSHPDVIRYYGISYTSLAATQAQMDWYAQLERTGTGIWWAIVSPGDNLFCGAAGLSSLHAQHKKAELGLWLLPGYWGQGIMPEVIPFICRYAFEQLGLHRIEAQVETENINCKAVMRKLGFTYEGCMRDCEIKDGKFISLEIYALLRTDTPA